MCGVDTSDSSSPLVAVLTIAFWGCGIVGGTVFVLLALGLQRMDLAWPGLVGWAGSIAAFLNGAAHFHYSRGRQILYGRRRVMPAREAPERADASARASARQCAAALWVANGDTEWVSVAAFSQLSLDLIELGAPIDLVQASHDAALDEVRHARLCWDLATKLDPAKGPHGAAPIADLGRTRKRVPQLDTLAVESFVQGAYLECVSAELARALLARCTDDDVRVVLETIRDDEGKHAEHAWAIVAWCAARSPDAARALERAGALPVPRWDPSAAGAAGQFEGLGLAGEAMQQEVEARVRREASARLQAVLRAARATASTLATAIAP
jgi:hypothetical protein